MHARKPVLHEGTGIKFSTSHKVHRLFACLDAQLNVTKMLFPLLQAYAAGYEVPGFYGHMPQAEQGINGTWDHAQHHYLQQQHMHQQHAYSQVSYGNCVQAIAKLHTGARLTN